MTTMQTGTRKCSVCEATVSPEDIALDEQCAIPAGEHLRLTGSTGSSCRVVMCKTCHGREIEAQERDEGLTDGDTARTLREADTLIRG